VRFEGTIKETGVTTANPKVSKLKEKAPSHTFPIINNAAGQFIRRKRAKHSAKEGKNSNKNVICLIAHYQFEFNSSYLASPITHSAIVRKALTICFR
jgi:hypothetical protein